MILKYFNLRMALALWVLGCIACAAPLVSAAEHPSVTIGIIGDSTVSNYPQGSAMRGWGQMLPEFLKEGAVVINEARQGASTKNFEPQRWQKILDARPDFVLIQFGHNDSHAPGRPESTDARTDFRENLRRFIAEARSVGATPILVTPPHRRLFRNGSLTNELAAYVDAMQTVGAEEGVAVIDLQAASGEAFRSLGEEGSTFYTVNAVQGQSAEDRTHFSEAGARELARMVAAGLATADPRLKQIVQE